MRISFWSRLRLAPQITLVILGSILAVIAVDKVKPFLIRPPEFMFFDRTWLVDQLREIRDRSHSASPHERLQIIETLPARRWLDVTLLGARPKFRTYTEAGGLGDLRRRIASALELAPEDILLVAADLSDPDRSPRALVAIIPDLPAMVDVVEDSSEGVITSDLRIAFRVGPDDWLLVMPRSDGREVPRMIRNVVLPLLVLGLIAVMSIWVARGIVRPLSDLAAAAEKLGRERELSLVGQYESPELQAIGNSFNDMQQRLKTFIDERLQMIAAISHDLRTPLTRMRLLAEYLSDPDQRRQMLFFINDMDAMMSTTLSFASNRLSEEQCGTVDLGALLISLCDTAADVGNDVVYDGPDHADLFCQPVAIRRAFSNLIVNGCKFGKQVWVTLRETDQSFIVTVADDGPGIPEDQRENAFRPFKRLESSRGIGGTGLGLTIARDVIVDHQGTINLSDAEDGGLLVTVSIPRQRKTDGPV